ncbi:MAG: ABC transporter permease, partial [Gammaproteobacteria bacterium]|nr:ABC transporter permease [Gammaproteobacteria bacterium]
MIVLRMLLRDWRGGELGVLLAALVVAVAIVSGISAFTGRLQSSLEQESHRFLAADLVVAGSREHPAQWWQQAGEGGLLRARTLAFPSMVYAGEEDMYLAAVKAVSTGYPLRGELLMSAQPFGDPQIIGHGPALGTVWLDSRLFPLLNVAIGDRIHIGDAGFEVTAAVRSEPDRAGSILGFGPRVLMHIDDIPTTGVVQPGSRVEYRLLLAGETEKLAAYQQWLEPQLSNGFRLIDVNNSQRGIGRALQRAESFLLLAGSLGVVLAGVAIALAARRFSVRHYDYVAIMKSLGASSRKINRIYALSLLAIGVSGILLGSVLGWSMQALFFE